MRLYIPIVAPKLIDFLEHISALGVGGDGKPGIAAITLAPFIFSWEKIEEELEAHEAIHVHQQIECGVVGTLLIGLPVALLATLLTGQAWWVVLLACFGSTLFGFLPFLGWFYWLYGILWLHWYITSKPVPFRVRDQAGRVFYLDAAHKAYYLIPFEREAFLYDQDGLGYLKTRKWFAWARVAEAEKVRPGAELPEHLFATVVTYRASGSERTPQG